MGPTLGSGLRRVALDSNTLIYAVEQVQGFYPLVRPLFEQAEQGRVRFVASELLIAEVLVRPEREADAELLALYDLALGPGDDATGWIETVPVSRAVLRRTARVRASYGLKTPDAIHAATALLAGVDEFVTNDAAFRRVAGLPVTLVSELPGVA